MPLEEPADALIAHVRVRLATVENSPGPCALAMRNGTTLEARGTPEALGVVERALAELR